MAETCLQDYRAHVSAVVYTGHRNAVLGKGWLVAIVMRVAIVNTNLVDIQQAGGCRIMCF